MAWDRARAVLRAIWPSRELERRRSWHRIDAVVAVFAIAVAAVFFHGRWDGAVPYIDLDGDSAQVASFCAAMDHPDLFPEDALLSERQNFGFYATVQVPLIRALARYVTHDYGLAVILPLPLLLFLQAFGFYRLGTALYKNRIVALALSCSTFLYYPFTLLRDYWGTSALATPRNWFQAFLPLVLAYLVRERGRPWALVWAHLAMGLLIYVHPVSTPPWAFALWLGCWVLHPPSWTFGKRVKWSLLCTAAFFVAATPFALQYLTSHVHGVTQSYEAVYRITKSRFGSGYLEIARTAQEFLQMTLDQRWLPVAVCGSIVLWLARKQDRTKLYLVWLWVVGLTVTSFVVPYFEQEIARQKKMMPVEVDFVRSWRYLVVLLHVLCLWPLTLFGGIRRPSRALTSWWSPTVWIRRGLAAAAAAWLLSIQIERTPPDAVLDRGLRALEAGTLLRRDPNKSAGVLALEAVRDLTPPRSRLLVASDRVASQVRFFALRQVLHSWKDGGPFAYANHAALIRWNQQNERFNKAKARSSKRMDQLAGWLDEGRRMKADYALLSQRLSEQSARDLGVTIVYANQRLTLVKLTPD
jgi:hypothetical protein